MSASWIYAFIGIAVMVLGLPWLLKFLGWYLNWVLLT